MGKIIKENKLLIGISILFLSVIIPVLIMNNYNNPVADDFSQYNVLINILNGRDLNFVNLLKVIARYTIQMYSGWQGTYFSHALAILNPLLISISAYKYIMILYQMFFLFSIFFLFICLSKIKILITKKQAIILAMLYISYIITFMYSTAEGLYWFSGAGVYLIPFSLSMIYCGLLILYFKNKNKFVYLLLIVLSVCIAGGSYVTGMFISFLLFVITLINLIKKSNNFKFLLPLLIVFGISFGLNVFCPGNSVRVNNYGGTSMTNALLMAFPLSIRMIYYVVFKTLLLPILIFLIPLFIEICKKIKYQFKAPLLSSLITFFAFTLFFVPCTYAYGTYYQELRVLNIQFFYLTLFLTGSLFYLVGYFVNNKLKFNLSQKNLKHLCLIIGMLVLLVMTSAIGIDNFKTKIISDELIYDKAKNYDLCMNEIFKKLSDPGVANVTIRNCQEYPVSLHHYVFPVGDSWITNDMETYFNKTITIEY